MNVYIAGPLTLGGRLSHEEAEANRSLFATASARLQEIGHYPVDPTVLVPGPALWQDAMRSCLQALLDCDAVLMLPGWEESPGASEERRLAMRLGIGIWYWPL